MASSLDITTFDCGCVWRWWVGEPSPKNNKWEKQCEAHTKQNRPYDNTMKRECCCLNVGQDDGATTCWLHHDCYKGECTHMDNDDERESEDEDDGR